MRKFIFVLLGLILLGSGLVVAIPQNASSVTEYKLPRWVAVSGAAANVTTEGGNISEVNVTAAEQLTDRWAGFYGLVTPSTIRLRASGDVNDLYNWTGTLAGGGEVCVSVGPNFDFSAIQEATEADVDSQWSFGAVADNVTETYTGVGSCALVFTDVNTTLTDTADEIVHAGFSTFTTCAFKDIGSPAVPGDLAFCTAIDTAGTNYNNVTVNYELMVPTDDGVGATETYYFFVEIN